MPSDGEPTLATLEQGEDLADSRGGIPASARTMPAEDQSSDGEADVSFQCERCKKTYSTEQALKGVPEPAAQESSKKRGKRKAVETPDVSPDSKRMTKRPTDAIKEEDISATQSLLSYQQQRPSGQAAPFPPPGSSVPQCRPPPIQNPGRGLSVEDMRNFETTHPYITRVPRYREIIPYRIPTGQRYRFNRANLVASAPGSRKGSKPPLFPEQSGDSNSESDAQDSGSDDRALSEGNTPMLRKRAQPVTMHRPPPPPTNPNDPILFIRINSNNFDPNGAPIFSILKIRPTEKFGPGLYDYCQTRNKRYGVDWIFVFRYGAPTAQNMMNEKHINITYDMTPNDVRDDEYAVALEDKDTIYVMKAYPRGSEAPRETWEIINGETKDYQDAQTSLVWIGHIKNEILLLRTQIERQASIIAQQKQRLAELQAINISLRRGVEQMRGQAHHPVPRPDAPSSRPGYTHV
ncbi:hypothetical protein N0V83_009720 [Neocucurbitaria cava]|uniref:Uncharacterized protein n=1 Tax=Neocucurbitaria cava TaxID=798079 RepID=A0A9W8XZ17_9PLEO|nr:hypothetical protein N0V83_009720 [Neocucurbitaria cava]